jgi:hypothetical protein
MDLFTSETRTSTQHRDLLPAVINRAHGVIEVGWRYFNINECGTNFGEDFSLSRTKIASYITSPQLHPPRLKPAFNVLHQKIK